MRIVIGTQNKAKLKAISDAIDESPYFWEWVIVEWISAESWVSEQPRSLEETLSWAIWRVKHMIQSGEQADYYIGLEWGVSLLKDSGMLFWFVAISNGTNLHFANSSMIPLPENFKIELFENKADLWDLARTLSWDSDITHKWGTYWELTDGMITRDIAFKQAIHCAFAPFFNKNYI